jgi:photosystem II stability/assembly factor-like uncharacterized protein
LSNTVDGFAVSTTSLFARVSGGGVFRSTDGGDSWAPANDGLTNTHVLALAASGTTLFAGTDGGVFRSIDDGASWTPVSGLSYTAIPALAVSGTSLFAAAPGDGVFRSPDDGVSWMAVNTGLMHELAASG